MPVINTALDLITFALRRIGSLGQGETPNASESTDALGVLNAMQDSWSADRLNIYNVPTLGPLNLTAAKGSYQIGPGAADFSTVARPIIVQAATFIPATGPSIEHPLDLLDSVKWRAIPSKTDQSPLVRQIYYDNSLAAAGYSVLNLFPVPSAGGTLNLDVWLALQQFALTDVIHYPAGYVEALRLNLALKLCTEFGMQIPLELPGEAAQALANMRALNSQFLVSVFGQATSGEIPIAGMPRMPVAPVPPAQTPPQPPTQQQ